MVYEQKVKAKAWLLIVCMIVLATLMISNGKVWAAGGTFPVEPFNGMQISYSISGANISGSTDKPGFSTVRSLVGTLGTETLQVSGSVLAGGLSADVVVTVKAGAESNTFKANVKGGQSQSFSVSVPIAQGAASGSISINMTGYYNNSGGQTRGLVVDGVFTGSSTSPSPQPPSPAPPSTPSQPNTPSPQKPSPSNPNPLQFPLSAPTPPPPGAPVTSPASSVPPPAPSTSSQQVTATAQPPAETGTDWGKWAKAAVAGALLGAALFTVASIGALGYVALADEGIVLGFPLLARIAAFMWERPYIGGVVRWGYDKLLKFTQTGLPTLTVLWTNYGNLKDYLAHNDFWKRHYEQLGNSKLPSNWDYDKGPTGPRRER